MTDNSRRTDRTTIGIAVVEDRGQVLVGVRQPGQHLAGLAEFPGGKCEPEEEPAQCAVRECREETGLDVSAVRFLARTQCDYPQASVDLHFWLCHLVIEPPADAGRSADAERSTEAGFDADAHGGSGNLPGPRPCPKPQNGFQWKTVDELQDLPFPEANAEVIELLGRGSF